MDFPPPENTKDEKQEKGSVSPPSPPSVPAPPKPAAKKVPEKPIPAVDAGGSGSLRVSLMPDNFGERHTAKAKKRVIILIVVLLAETLLIGGAFLLVLREEGKKSVSHQVVREELDTVRAKVKIAQDNIKDAATFNAQADIAADILDEHVYWSAFFEYMESKTRSTIKYLNFLGDLDKHIVTVDAVGRSYKDVAQQIVLMRDDPVILEVRTTAAAAQINDVGEVTGVSFTMILELDPDIWELKTFAPAPKPAPLGLRNLE